MTIARCIILKVSLSTSSASRPGVLNRRPCGPLPKRGALRDCNLGRTHDSDWLQLTRILTGNLHRSFHSVLDFWLTTWLLPLNYSGASCSEKSLIDDQVKSQYTTYIYMKLVTVVEGDEKVPFSIATTPRYRGGRYSFPRIAPFYPRDPPYIAEC